jgi:hypothetical protein
MEIVAYTSDKAELWDSFVLTGSMNGTVYHTRKFLSYHKDKFEDTSILLYKEDILLCVVPCCYRNGTNFSHSGATYGGPVIAKCQLSVKDMETIINEIFNHYKGNFECRLANDIYFAQPVHLIYYLLSRKLKAHLELSWYVSSGSDIIQSITNKRNKKYVFRMMNDLNYVFLSTTNTEDYIEFYTILKENLQQNHDTTPTHSLEEFLTLMTALLDKQELFIVKHSKKIVAGVYVIKVTSNCWYTFYISRNINIKNSGTAIIYIMSNIAHIAFKNNAKYVDYGITTENMGSDLNLGLSEYKNESLGGISNYRYLLKLS